VPSPGAAQPRRFVEVCLMPLLLEQAGVDRPLRPESAIDRPRGQGRASFRSIAQQADDAINVLQDRIGNGARTLRTIGEHPVDIPGIG